MSREDHWYIPGKTEVEKQHISEHETIQIMQRHAVNGEHEKFYQMLLGFSRSADKRNDAARLCGYESSKDAMEKSCG